MKRYFLFFAVILFFGCIHKKEKNANFNMIPKQEMIQILVDVELAESAIVIEQSRNKNIDIFSTYYYDSVFKKYKISRKQFEENLKYYAKKDDDFNEMYIQVINILSRKQSEVMQK